MPSEIRRADAETTENAARTPDLETSVAKLAQSHADIHTGDSHYELLNALDALEVFLSRAHRTFSEQAQKEAFLPSYSAEWLLDNFYIVQQALRQVREDLSKSYYRELPKLNSGSWAAYPRIYGVACAYINRQRAQISPDTLQGFVEAYQEIQPLRTGELWALPIMLRTGILQSLTGALASVLDEQDLDPDPPLSTTPELDADTLVANCILSLRAISNQDWKDFYEEVSLLEQALASDPAGVYQTMDFQTRDRYRKVVEKLAKATRYTEQEVAQRGVDLALQAASAEETPAAKRRQHVGYYLIDAGRHDLESIVDYEPGYLEQVRTRLAQRHPALTFLGGIGLLTAMLMAVFLLYEARYGASAWMLLASGLILLIPILSLVVSFVNGLVVFLVKPRVLPKLDYEEEIPERDRSMVVVPCIIGSIEEIDLLLDRLERHYLSNPSPYLSFALLTDFADALQEKMPGDERLLAYAQTGILDLNKRYAQQPFFMFHRRRRWNEQEGLWMGWERKRGKLEEFNQLLQSQNGTSYELKLGNLSILPQIRYVVTVDADTILPQRAAHKLIGTLAHPLNQALFDPESGRITAGYSVLQPRMETEAVSANRTRFSRVYSGASGLDLYSHAVSDVYQDLFGEGIYVGKGIYDVEAFVRSLQDRAPENILLSHDLFEGIHGRAGLVTDIVLYEDFPSSYLAFAQRRHRWIRGDWQLIPWLRPRVYHAQKGRTANTLSAIDTWKVIDNLRRSLLSLALMILLVTGWLWLPGAPGLWTSTAALVPAGALIGGLAVRLVQRVAGRDGAGGIVSAVRQQLSRWLLFLIFLPYETRIAVDAIATSLIRLGFTRTRLLQWTTAAETSRLARKQHEAVTIGREMGGISLFALLLLILLAWLNPTVLPIALPFIAAWFLSPLVVLWLRQPAARQPQPLQPQQEGQLRRLARNTWFYFERFIGPDDHWLPPDHFQEHPRGLVAHRTSPTNIGLGLLSLLAGFDFGYIGLGELALRLRYTFQSLDTLERYRGHFLNWYDTRTKDALPARYVSTVDSGNLAGCLLALQQGCEAMADISLPRWARWQGLTDTFAMLDSVLQEDYGPDARETVSQIREQLAACRQRIEEARDKPREWTALRSELAAHAWPQLEKKLVNYVNTYQLSKAQVHRIRIWMEASRHNLFTMKRQLENFMPWLRALNETPALLSAALAEAGNEAHQAKEWRALAAVFPPRVRVNDIGTICKEGLEKLDALRQALESSRAKPADVTAALQWIDALAEDLQQAIESASEFLNAYAAVSQQCTSMIREMSFGFLYDPNRRLFRIGYNVDEEKPDPNYYDLLASEARTASLIAIAMGEVPQAHWLTLGRPLRDLSSGRSLISWSGSMFEYLMPILWMRHYDNTLLHESAKVAVQTQIDYGQRRDVPWGVSESGYYRFDAALNYQYKAFGVPQLAFQRGLEQELVISPYASLLALRLRPQAVMQNMERLLGLNMWGDYGFYEALDFTKSRLSLGEEHAHVRSFMIHHQAMILLSLANTLHNDVMVERFHAHPRIKSVDLLLQERIPVESGTVVEDSGSESFQYARQEVTMEPWRVPIETASPQAQYLSNGRYGLLISNGGGGFSRWRDTELTRWRADSTRDEWGTWIYLQDMDGGKWWSAAPQPAGKAGKKYEVIFYPHKVDFIHHGQLSKTHTEATVVPGDDVEIRRVRITNQRSASRKIRVVSYGEVILAPQETDRRHPAFNKLFIESEYRAAENALLFTRRPRSAEEKAPVMAHQAVVEADVKWSGSYETDRERFVGRGGNLRAPAILSAAGATAGSADMATLDPVMSHIIELELPAHSTVSVAFLVMAGENREAVISLTEKYGTWLAVERAFGQARAQSERELQLLKLDTPTLRQFQKLLSLLHYPSGALRAKADVLEANKKGQSGLWAYGISGDYPIVLAHIRDEEELRLARELLKAHLYWRSRGLKIDLVLMNEKPEGYSQQLQGQLRRSLHRMDSDDWLNRRGGIFLLQREGMSTADHTLVASAARVVLDGKHGPLAAQLRAVEQQRSWLPGFVPARDDYARPDVPALKRPEDLSYWNGWGGFSGDGQEYVIHLEPDDPTPAPWSNVIANAAFGCLVSEAGSGFTWSINSGENRLTPWNNDPVRDRPGEVLYLRDEETAEIWTATPSPAGAAAAHLVRHGAGYTSFEANSHGLRHRQRIFVAPDAPLKIVQLRLENVWEHVRRISATFYAEWVLGVHRDATQQFILSECDMENRALLARNPYHAEFGDRVAFLAASEEIHGFTADRTEFLGRHGDVAQPAALKRVGLSDRAEAGVDPCAALQVHIDLQPGETKEIYFLLGQGANREDTLQLVQRFQKQGAAQQAWAGCRDQWQGFMEAVTVDTPDEALNILLNRWLPYQNLACRIWGRSAFYQSGGAFGFRDQLQDVMAVLHHAPAIAREHILRAAQHQFEAGDVLHWWHPPSGRGVRTRIRDDLLWLPYVTAHYVRATADETILREEIPFREGEPLEEGHSERYGHFGLTEAKYTLYEHCCRAIAKGATGGPHGLPLIGAGDWNDGFNRVGLEGKGESVWLGWFLYKTLRDFIPICRQMNDGARAEKYEKHMAELQNALRESAWDGEWYVRAYYDDGTPLGSSQNSECRIDSIAQSWAAISGAGDGERIKQALNAVDRHLIDEVERLLLLFTPPLDKTPKDPGYIKGYPPGIRENGGQYTHAAIWTVWAHTLLGEGDRAWELFSMLNAITRSDTHQKAAHYRVEPYVTAADIYGVKPFAGRGGWTWYTGSGGWLYRLGLEAILGITREGDSLRLAPCLPRDWTGYKVAYRFGRSIYSVEVEKPAGVCGGVESISVNGEPVSGTRIALRDDKSHHVVRVKLGDVPG